MTDMPKIAIYPGSFDPVTNGHLDIIERGLKLFDKIIIAILTNPGKQFLFTLEERMQMLEVCLKKFPNVKIDTFNGLTVDYAAQCNAQGILRGLRALSDFEYEFQMALMNRRLNREIQTVFLMLDIYQFINYQGSRPVRRQHQRDGATGSGEENQREICPEAVIRI